MKKEQEKNNRWKVAEEVVADVSVPCYIWRLSNASKGLIYGTLVSVPCYIWRLSNIGMSWANTNVVSVPCYIWRLSNLISRHHKHGQAPLPSLRGFQQSHLKFSPSDGLWIDLTYSIANSVLFSNRHGLWVDFWLKNGIMKIEKGSVCRPTHCRTV